MGATIPMRYCTECGAAEAAKADDGDRARSLDVALRRAGATPRLRTQTLESHPDPAARAAAEEWIERYATGERCNLWLSGPVGTGKTGLAWGIVERLTRESVDRYWSVPEDERSYEPHVPAVLVRWADLLDDLKSSFDAERRALATGDVADPSLVLERAKSVAILALDDLGRERPTPYAVEKLANLVEQRYQRLVPTIVTSNYSTRDLTARLGEGTSPIDGKRIVTRLIEGAVAHRFEGESRRKSAASR